MTTPVRQVNKELECWLLLLTRLWLLFFFSFFWKL